MTPETARLLAKTASGFMVAERTLANAQETDDLVVVQAAEVYLAQLDQLAAVLKAARA